MKSNIGILILSLLVLLSGCSGKDSLPAAPSELQAEGFTAISYFNFSPVVTVGLHWKDNSNNEAGFHIEMKQGNGIYTNEGETITTQLTDFGYNSPLQINTLYTYKVRAFNTSGNSAFSNEASLTVVDLQSLGFVETRTADQITSTTARCGVTISNDGGLKIISSGVYYNEIPISQGGGGVTAIKSVPNGPGTGSFLNELTGLKPGTTYYVWAYVEVEKKSNNFPALSFFLGNEITFTTN